MIRWRTATVQRLGATWPGSQELVARLTCGPDAGTDVKALAHPDLVGTPRPGDRVLLNTSAQARGLGTGGYALVVALPDALPTDPPDGPGHLVKARYTPLQTMVLGVDDQESTHHQSLADADDLAGTPVVVADLHSALPAIVAGIRADAPDAKVAYVMTDGGALPAAFSRAVAGLREAGWLAACITTGQSFGGDLEAVTVHTGLLAAHVVVGADVVVVSQGPGNLGTGSRWGFSGVAVGEALNAAAVLRGHPVAALRVSEADPRDRHRGVSHHSLTAVGRVALAPADVVVPDSPGPFYDRVREQARTLCGRHTYTEVPAAGLDAALATSPVKLSTMGRGLEADRAAFLTAAVAGRHAASLITTTRS